MDQGPVNILGRVRMLAAEGLVQWCRRQENAEELFNWAAFDHHLALPAALVLAEEAALFRAALPAASSFAAARAITDRLVAAADAAIPRARVGAVRVVANAVSSLLTTQETNDGTVISIFHATNEREVGSTSSSSRSSPSAPPAKRQKIAVAPFAASVFRRTRLSSSRWVNNVPHHIWVYKILNPFLDLKALSTVRRCNTFFEEYWQYVLKQNVIRVPEGCPTMHHAMALAVIFSERNECTRENPVKVEVGEGEHEMVGVASNSDARRHTRVSCNNITIVGKGKGKSTILGGFYVNGKQNVKMEQLTVNGIGLICTGSATNVDAMECIFKNCKLDGVTVSEGATVAATRCEFMENAQYGVGCAGANTTVRFNNCTMHHNGMSGLFAYNHAVVDLHGAKTGIHSNKSNGIVAITNAKVNIHLSSQHNTSHDNVRQNRAQDLGGSIANINADGTFTHVEEVDLDDDEDEHA